MMTIITPHCVSLGGIWARQFVYLPTMHLMQKSRFPLQYLTQLMSVGGHRLRFITHMIAQVKTIEWRLGNATATQAITGTDTRHRPVDPEPTRVGL